MGGCQIRPCLQLHVVYGRQNLGRVALAVSFSGFHSGRCPICCTVWTVMLISSLLWGICSSLDSGLLATAVKVSKSCHNSTIKLLIQNPQMSFQDNTAISSFQSLIFSDCQDMRTAILQNDTQTHDDYCIPLGLRPLRHNQYSQAEAHRYFRLRKWDWKRVHVCTINTSTPCWNGNEHIDHARSFQRRSPTWNWRYGSRLTSMQADSGDKNDRLVG